jgi:hypothetical protein
MDEKATNTIRYQNDKLLGRVIQAKMRLSWSEDQVSPFRSVQVDQERVPGPGRYLVLYLSISKILPDANVTLAHGDRGLISHFTMFLQWRGRHGWCTAAAHSRSLTGPTSLVPCRCFDGCSMQLEPPDTAPGVFGLFGEGFE